MGCLASSARPEASSPAVESAMILSTAAMKEAGTARCPLFTSSAAADPATQTFSFFLLLTSDRADASSNGRPDRTSSRALDDEAGHVTGNDTGGAQKESLAAVAGEPVLNKCEKVAGPGGKKMLLLPRRRKLNQPLHQTGARLAAGELQLLAPGLAVDVFDEEVAVLDGGELVQLQHLVCAAKVLLLLVREHAEEEDGLFVVVVIFLRAGRPRPFRISFFGLLLMFTLALFAHRVTSHNRQTLERKFVRQKRAAANLELITHKKHTDRRTILRFRRLRMLQDD
ncbi:hypothetical protein L249_0095 [Ophiocordyceps polyrhachis-furcata BCC 54312]|uniref:Uncharacterized protein n=1 Tax=Ophiocordyceps polyrhachis-furcata BCC 54312 TaxID=1330021 RepID=A0A367LEE0_9HYPO|nr:hypothetical protein L249_0095 [Ophiocordyceps polyrhachis-furcata BCC 54312]